MKDYSKLFMEDIVSTAKRVNKSDREKNGSVEIKVSDTDIKKILDRKRLRKGLKDNLIKDLTKSNLQSSTCDTNSLCIVIPKEKLEKTIIKYGDIK